MIRYFSLPINIATFLAGVVFFQCHPVQSQEQYITRWLQFEMVPGWQQVDTGKDFPSVVGPVYFGAQPKVDILFGTVNQTLEEVSVISKRAFSTQMPEHTLITQRFFNTAFGFPAFDYTPTTNGTVILNSAVEKVGNGFF